jgi:hypothetical protein
MLPSWILIIGAVLSVAGTWSYVVATVRGETQPNRVTWIMWAVAPLLAFAIEVQQGVGASSLATLLFGVLPIFVLVASVKNPNGQWKVSWFDGVCGVVSVVGLVVWLSTNHPTWGLMAQVVADAVAGLPTLSKAMFHPQTESPFAFFTGVVNSALALLVLHHWTTAGALFPLSILIMNSLIVLFITTRWAARSATA